MTEKNIGMLKSDQEKDWISTDWNWNKAM